MALTPEQQAEADKLGISYDVYEKLLAWKPSDAEIKASVDAISNAVAGLSAPGAAEAIQKGIADVIGPINPLTMLGSDTVGPIFNPTTFVDTTGNTTVVNERNPTNVPDTERELKNVVGVARTDTTFFIIIQNNSINKGTTKYKFNGQTLDEGSRTQFDSKQINDRTDVLAEYDSSKFIAKNRFVITKGSDPQDLYVTEFVDGVETGQSKSYRSPTAITLDFRYDAISGKSSKASSSTTTSSRIIAGGTSYSITQQIGFLTNYSQSPFNIRVESADLPSALSLKPNDTATIVTNNTAIRDVAISISNTGNYDLVGLTWTYAGDNAYTNEGFRDGKLIIPANRLTRNINVSIELKPSENKIAGVQLDSAFNRSVPGTAIRSKFTTAEIQIPIAIRNAEGVIVKTPFGQRLIGATAGSTYENKVITLDLKTDFKNNIGSFKVAFVPTNSAFGDTPNPGYATINLTEIQDTPLINVIDFPESITIPTYTLGDYPFTVNYAASNTDYVVVYHTKEDDSTIIGKYSPSQLLNFNFNKLREIGAVNGSVVDFIFIPFNDTNVNGTSTIETIRGDVTKIKITFDIPPLFISTDKLKEDLFDAIAENIDFDLQDRPRYLNHLAEFDKNDKQIVISNWETDRATFTNFRIDELGNQIPININQSIVLKLYEPLPTNINKNDTLWISEIMSLPIVRTITVTGETLQPLVYLRGPNFNIDVDFVKEQSTSFESLDNLILTGSTTSQQIVDKYLYDNFYEVDKVNIDYSNFANFIKYSSAVERLANFKYKKELLEFYDDKIAQLQPLTGSISAITEMTSFQTKKVNLLTALDGWENYLVSSSESTFPKDENGFAQKFTTGSFDSNGAYNFQYAPTGSGTTTTWFNAELITAEVFDKNNRNALKNNIPLYILDDVNCTTTEYPLFLDMIGHHFDIIWSHIKGITETKNITETNDYGIHDDFLYDYLKSFGWNAKNLNSNEQLWKYLFGKDADGNVKEELTPQERTKSVWRRIANNLPYLLKHKGTKRGISALLNCYGIPNSNLSIVEFGGPDTDDTIESTKYIYDTQTANLNFTSGSYLTTRWSGSEAIELRIKPAYSGSGMTLLKGNSFTLSLVPGNHASQTSGSLELAVSSSTGLETIVTNQYQFYDGNYHSILLNNETQGTSSTFTFYYKNGEKDRIVKQGTFNYIVDNAIWNTGSTIQIGGTYVGEMDEFRMWNTALSESAFDLHVLHPEAINGNHISASTTNLQVRLDFEYPKNIYTTASIKNVAPNNTYQTYVSASGFTNITSYPYQYEIVDRTVSLQVPNSGASRYSSNKVRFEDQTLVSDLSYKSRSTKKAFETSKRDSNRLGLFFSPNKDLDLDIAKSFGGVSIDDYIGAYDDQYQDTYKDLTDLRNYYFERIGERDIYQFINLIRLYDKSLFENLKEMLPARVKATTGLLIAPHLLERSKHKVYKPNTEYTSSNSETSINTMETTLIGGDVNIYDTELNLTASTTLIGEFNNYTTSINLETANTLEAENDSYEVTITDFDASTLVSTDNYYENNQTASIDTRILSASVTAEWELFGSTVVNVGEKYSDIGYNTYFDNGWARVNYEDYDGTYKSKKVRGFIVTRRSDLIIPTNLTGISGSFYEEDTLTDVFTQELILQEESQTASLASGLDIISITTASGYLKSHYIYTKDRSVGLENTFFKGSKQTTATTIDGRDAVEEFVSNPTILRVNENGRPNNEPILVVD